MLVFHVCILTLLYVILIVYHTITTTTTIDTLYYFFRTSAAMMTWCFYEYIHNDQLYQDVVDEAEFVFAPTIDWSSCHPESNIPPPEQLAKLQLAEASLRVSGRVARAWWLIW